MKSKKEKMTSTPCQFRDDQYETSLEIMKMENIKYFSEHIRNALDFYHEQKHPELVKKIRK